MKRIGTFIACMLFILSFNIISYGYTNNLEDMESLKPYKAIVDKVNQEYGKDIVNFISNEELESMGLSVDEIYKKISNTPLDEFETNIRINAKVANDLESNEIKIYKYNVYKAEDHSLSEGETGKVSTYKLEELIPTNDKEDYLLLSQSNKKTQPRYIRQDITQYLQWGNGPGHGNLNGKLYLNSTVFSGNGSDYTYERIIQHGYMGYYDRTYFKPTKSYHTLDSSRKNCEVVYNGMYFDPISGMSFASMVTITTTYDV